MRRTHSISCRGVCRFALQCLAVLIALAPPLGGAQADEAVRWEKLYTSQGITVYAGHRDGLDLPILKGVGVLDINLYHLLAIIDDVPAQSKWVNRLDESIIVRRPDPFNIRTYLRFNFPWPAYDRDGVIDVKVKREWAPHHQVWVRFQRSSDVKYPPRDGVIRVPRSQGYTRLRWIDAGRTEVVYQVDTDPSGDLPRWLVRWISERLPVQILTALDDQVEKTMGRYTEFIKHWDPRFRKQEDAPAQFVMPE